MNAAGPFARGTACRSRAPRRAAGFTLVEVLVALFIMAILAALAFRGVDALVHARDGAQAATDRTLKLNTGMSQFDYDVSQIVDTKVLPTAVMFDGATLRIARRSPEGMQLVMWTLQDRRWQRWASPPVTHMAQLTDTWMRSQQWDSISGNAVTVLDNVDAFQVYLYNNGWSNVQSTQNGTQTPTTPAVPGAPPIPINPTGTVPTGIRIVVKLPEGDITREKELPAL